MSRQSYSRHTCSVCGGNTAGNGFARYAHEHTTKHMTAMGLAIAAGCLGEGWIQQLTKLQAERRRDDTRKGVRGKQ